MQLLQHLQVFSVFSADGLLFTLLVVHLLVILDFLQLKLKINITELKINNYSNINNEF